MLQECANCHNHGTKLKRCSACSMVWYCNSECQKEHWVIHLVNCNLGRPITSADRLIASIRSGSAPEDEVTRRDYGFIHTPSMEAHSRRCQTFDMLLEDPKIKAKTLHQWMEAGNLGAMMRKEFDARRPRNAHQKAIYDWFCENQATFDPVSTPEINNEFKMVIEATRSAWAYMGRDASVPLEKISAGIRALTPDEDACFQLVTTLRVPIRPCAGQTMGPKIPHPWLYSGLCGCKNDDEENYLTRLYIQLIELVDFTTLHRAYVSSTLAKLFDDNGLGFHLPLVRDVLSSRNYKSVWYLKDFVCADDPIVAEYGDLHPSLHIDYGFGNCKNADEVFALRDTYKQILMRADADPLALHEACYRGEVFKYVQQLARLKPPQLFKRLMKNPHPLVQ